MFIEPYSDDYMTFNESSIRYTLTAKCVLDKLGIDLTAQAKADGQGVQAFLERVSMLTYRKMHEYGYDKWQDKIIATTEDGREVIQKAMLEQFFYMKSVGDLSLSTNIEERKLYASDSVVDILNETIYEIGESVINIAIH